MYKRILVPLDGSELSAKALDHAEKLAETFDSKIILFQVVPVVPVYGAPELMTPFFVEDKKQKETTAGYLTNLSEELKKRGFKATAEMKTGEQVAVEIVDFAKESWVDLIVMCTHGHSGITLWALGSVAHKVLIRSETPILLLPLKR